MVQLIIILKTKCCYICISDSDEARYGHNADTKIDHCPDTELPSVKLQ